MFIRVELDFKRNVFRLIGHAIAAILVALVVLFELNTIVFFPLITWFLFSAAYLFVNETIRIYLRKHKMGDILQNHPRLYWLTRGRIRDKKTTQDP